MKLSSLSFSLTLGMSVLLAGGGSEARAQEPEQERPVPRFEAGVSAVLVDALVLDDDGEPVEDLTRADFRIFEDGVEQEVATFDVTDWTSYVAARTSDERGGSHLPEDVELNAYPRRFVLVLNRQGARFEYLLRAKRAMSKLVVESLADGDEAMVIDIGYSTKILQEFVDDKQATLSAIDSLGRMEVPYRMGVDRAAHEVYRDLEALGRAFADYPGRKIVVFFSMELMTFPPPGTMYTNESYMLQRATEALNQSNTSIYTIDLAGVDSRGNHAYGGLSSLAVETGGRFFRNSTSFDPPLRRIGRENARYYLLGYVSTNAVADGSYRRIEVEVNRPDVDVVARPGYFARDDARKVTGVRRTANDGGSSERDGRDVGETDGHPLAVELTTYLLPTGTGTVRVPVSVALPHELLTGKGGRERKLELTISGENGEVLHDFEQDVDLASYFLLRQVDLEPGLYMLAIVLRSEERELYRASSGLKVPAGFGERFGLSSIVPVVSPDRSDAVGDGLPLLPTPSVKRGSDAYVLFQVFSGLRERVRRARVTYAVLDEEREILAGGREEPLALSDSPAGTPVVLSIPTRGLDFGRYRVEVRVEDPDDGHRATSDIELRVR